MYPKATILLLTSFVERLRFKLILGYSGGGGFGNGGGGRGGSNGTDGESGAGSAPQSTDGGAGSGVQLSNIQLSNFVLRNAPIMIIQNQNQTLLQNRPSHLVPCLTEQEPEVFIENQV